MTVPRDGEHAELFDGCARCGQWVEPEGLDARGLCPTCADEGDEGSFTHPDDWPPDA